MLSSVSIALALGAPCHSLLLVDIESYVFRSLKISD
jgi:hypothetical protein